MCPESEIHMREKNKLLHPFEILSGTARDKFPTADRHNIVKEYSRPAAGKPEPTPKELRPAPVLLTTVDYLMNHIVPKEDVPWCRVYEYVFDRLRAVRQDMVIQRISGQPAVTILEAAVRFHVYSGYRLCEAPVGDFDSHINNTHTLECLKRLIVLYEENESCRANAGEFIGLYLVYNLAHIDALTCGLTWKSTLSENKLFELSFKLSLTAWLGNYARVFKLAKRLPPLFQCAFHRNLPKLQTESLQVMSSAYNSKALKFNLEHLTDLLRFNNRAEATDICGSHGLTVANGGVAFNKAGFQVKEKIPLVHSKFVDATLKGVQLNALMNGNA